MKLYTLIVVCGVSLGLFLVTFSYHFSITQTQSALESSIELNNQGIIDQHFNVLNEDIWYTGRYDFQKLAEDKSILLALREGTSNATARAIEQISSLKSKRHLYDSINILDNGCFVRVTDGSGEAGLPTDYSNTDFCRGALATDGPYITQAFVSPISNRPTLAISTPIYDAKDQVQGFVIGIFNITTLEHAFSELYSETQLIILDRNSEKWFDSKIELTEVVPKSDCYFSEVVSNRGDENKGFLKKECEEFGGTFFVSFKKSEPFTVIVTQPVDVSLAPMEYLIDSSRWMTIFVAVVVLIAMWFLSRYIAKPMENLNKDVREILAGNLDLELQDSKISEVQSLTESIRQILASIKLAIIRTQATKKDLGLGEAIRAKKEAESKFETIFQVVPSGIYTLDGDNKVTSWNKQAAEITGYPEDDVIGKTMSKLPFFGRNNKCELLSDDLKLPLEGSHCQIKSKDGKTKYISASMDQLKDHNGLEIGSIVSFEDITKRKVAEEEIEKSEKKFKTLFNNMQDVVILSDLKGKVTGVNDAVTRFGFDKDKFIGTNYLSYIPRKYHPSLIKDMVSLARGKETEGTIEVNSPNGLLYVEYKTRPFVDDDGKKGLQSVLRDVTDKKRGKLEIEKFKIMAQRYFDMAGTMMVAVGSDGKVIDINEVGANILGYPKEDIIGKNWFEKFIPEQINDEVRKVFKEILSRKPRELHENTILTREGKQRLISWHNTTLKDDSGKIIGTLSSGEDITELRSAENDLVRTKERYRTLVEQSNDGIIVIGGPPLKIMFANTAMQEMLGYTLDEVMKLSDQQVLKLVHKDDRKAMVDTMQKRIKGLKAPKVTEARLIQRNGNIIWTRASGRRINYGGVLADQVTFTDITERKKAEIALIKSEQRYKNIVEHSTECFYQHDLNNVITYISPQSEDLLGYTPEEMGINWTKLTTNNPINQRGIELTEKAIKTGKNQEPYLLELKRKDGSIGLFEVNESPLIDAHGTVIGLTGALTDVTRQKKVQKTILENEAKYRLLIEQSPYGIAIVSGMPPKILLANEALAKISGFSIEDFEGMPPEKLINLALPQYREVLFDRLGEYLSNKRNLPTEFVFEAKTKSGEVKWIRTIPKIIEFEKGHALQSTFEDITDQVKLKNKLESSERMYKTLVEQSLEGIMLFTGPIPNILYANKTMEEISGYGVEELVTMSSDKIISLIHPDDVDKAMWYLQELSSGKITPGRYFDFRISQKDGKTIWVRSAGKPVKFNERIAVQVVFTDITKEKQAEEKSKKKSSNSNRQ